MTPTPPGSGIRSPWSRSDRPIPRTIVQPLQTFLHTEIASGIVLLGAAVIALVWANSTWSDAYSELWHTPLTISVGPLEISEDLAHWVNDLLMAFFFFVVGLEIKRELVLGELRDPKAAALPMLCALGGMVAPALLYTVFNAGGPAANGWGIPMATDIAFAVGVLALVGTRAPAGLKVFLLTLAIVDDLGAIIVIALFYSEGLALTWLGVAAAVVVAVLVMQRVGMRSMVPYTLAAGVLWLAIFESGVHATIAGVIMGFLTPSRPFQQPEAVAEACDVHLDVIRAGTPDGVADEQEQARLLEVSTMAAEAVSPLARLQARLHPWTSFLVLPLFALANAGVTLSGDVLSTALREAVTLGIVVGLVVGKPLGIMAAAAIAVALRVGKLPPGVGWLEMLGVGSLAGVGFTVAIFVAGLAFTDDALTSASKVGILAASLIAGIIGAVSLALRDAAKDPAASTAD